MPVCAGAGPPRTRAGRMDVALVQAHLGEQLADQLLALLLVRHPVESGPHHDLADRHAGISGWHRILEDDLEISPDLLIAWRLSEEASSRPWRSARVRQVEELPCAGSRRPARRFGGRSRRITLARRRLPAAGLAHEPQRLAPRDAEAHPVRPPGPRRCGRSEGPTVISKCL